MRHSYLYVPLFCIPMHALADIPRGIEQSSSLSNPAEQRLPPVGAYQTVAINRPDVIAAALFAVQELNKEVEQGATWELIAIVKAEVQVVAGLNHRLQLLLLRRGQVSLHEVIVLSQAWLQLQELTAHRILDAIQSE